MKLYPVTLEVTTWRGVSLGAEHYYGKLIDSNGGWNTAEIRARLTSSMAKKLSKKDDWNFRAGAYTTRFETHKQVVDIAIREYKIIFPQANTLLCGSPTTAEPIEPIDGPAAFMGAATKIYAEYSAFGWVNRGGMYYRRPEDRERIDQLTELWNALLRSPA